MRTKARLRALGMMAGFGLLGLVALAVTVGTYNEAAQSGGTYFIWYGGILCGVIGFLYGLVKLVKIGT